MAADAPLIDTRTYGELVEELEALVEGYTGALAAGWHPPKPDQPPDPGSALIRLGARMAELAIARLNRVPDKAFLAFLDLIGADLGPPQPARVPLTFELAAGSPVDALVPAGTLAAAPPLEGGKEPALFATERDLVVTRTALIAAAVHEPDRDRWSDRTDMATGTVDGSFDAFRGETLLEHALYVGHTGLLAGPPAKEVVLQFDAPALSQDAVDADTWLGAVEWERWDGASWAGLAADLQGHKVVLTGVPPVPVSTVGGWSSSWLRGRLSTPLPHVEPPSTGDSPLTRIAGVRISTTIQQPAVLTPDLGFSNQVPLDLKKDFFPFGEKPRIGDAFYLACDEVFAHTGASVTLSMALTNPADPARASDDLVLEWQFWNGLDWSTFGRSGKPSIPGFKDDSKAFTIEGSVTFPCPEARPVTVGGEQRRWIRVRLAQGNYGADVIYEPITLPAAKDAAEGSGLPAFRFVPATFKPPSLRAVRLGYVLTSKTGPPERLLTVNDFAVREVSGGFTPFLPPQESRPALYLGFERPGDTAGFANRTATLYLGVEEALYQPAGAPQAPAEAAVVVWDYWNGEEWHRLGARDETRGLTRRGLVTFIGPADFGRSTALGRTAFWLRARWERGGFVSRPRLGRVLTNTTWAVNAQTVNGEVLGSSRGEGGQSFRTRRTPVLAGQELEVREPELPSAEDRAALAGEEGEGAVSVVPGVAGQPAEVWVRWQEVPDFYGSAARSRHYTLDRARGEIRFGDGRRGFVPPPGKASLRLSYQVGGGPAGNRPAGSIVQIKGTVPYVDGVAQHEPAAGGAPEESLEAVRAHGPKRLRHRDRATALADVEDLAFQASAEVARVQGIGAGVGGDGAGRAAPGTVGLIVVPRSAGAQPVPSLELLERVRSYLEARLSPVADLWVAGPDWVRVKVEAEIVPAVLEQAAEVRSAVLARLAVFLHPLTGGPEGAGWAFGRKPYRSDLYALLEATPGVDHVQLLRVEEDPEDGVARPGRFLIFSGPHEITLAGGTDEAANSRSAP